METLPFALCLTPSRNELHSAQDSVDNCTFESSTKCILPKPSYTPVFYLDSINILVHFCLSSLVSPSFCSLLQFSGTTSGTLPCPLFMSTSQQDRGRCTTCLSHLECHSCMTLVSQKYFQSPYRDCLEINPSLLPFF